MGSGTLKRLRFPTPLITLFMIPGILAVWFCHAVDVIEAGIERKSIPAEIRNSKWAQTS